MEFRLCEYLFVRGAASTLSRLKRLATFRRKGRLRPGQRRTVKHFRHEKDLLTLPRGLYPQVHALYPAVPTQDERLTVRPLDFRFRMQLRDYQAAAVDAIAAQGGGVVVADPGSGKTLITLALAARWRQPALFLVHTLELAEKTRRDALEAFGLPSRAIGMIADAQRDSGTHLTIATMQTLAKNPRLTKDLAAAVGTVIVDECLVATSRILMSNQDGRVLEKPIISLRVGDWVWAYDESSGRLRRRQVRTIFRRSAPHQVFQITANGQGIVATGNHPFLTKDGWKRADELTPRDYLYVRETPHAQEKTVHRLRKVNHCSSSCHQMPDMQWLAASPRERTVLSRQSCAVYTLPTPDNTAHKKSSRHMASVSSSILLSKMLDSSSTSTQIRKNGRNQRQVFFVKDAPEQSYEKRHQSAESQYEIKSHAPSALPSRREWEAFAGTASTVSASAGVADGSYHQDGSKPRIRLPFLLQSRHRTARVQNSCGGRWPISRCTRKAVPRSKENNFFSWVRVDRIAIFQRGRDAEFERLCPDGQVFNLEVTGIHTFIANGFVTHNCHHSPAATFADVIGRFPAKYLLGASATPSREDGLGPMVTALLGPPVKIPRRVLLARKVIVEPQVKIVRTGWIIAAGTRWPAMEKARAEDRARNVLIAQAVWRERQRGQRVLVLVERKDHAQLLVQLLRRAQIPAYAVDGDVAPELRRRFFAAMETGQAVVVATQLANEGLDWPALEVAMLAAPGKSLTALHQRTGRVSRTAPGKEWATVYDFADWDVAVYRKQAQIRMAWYREIGYRVTRVSIAPKEAAHGQKSE